MSLVVPVLRLFLLFLNVFETFKTLKPPQRSARTGERTVRTVAQRKRDMKGCMAIWLVWCSCAILEGPADSTIGIVMPFYSEFKAIVYLFQILTRARGAEPIYLHVMRPLIKPYVNTLDWALELTRMIGDFVMLILSLPFDFVLQWIPWRKPSIVATGTPEPEKVATEQRPERTHLYRQPSNGSVALRTRGSRQVSDSASEKIAVAGPSRIARPNGFPHSRSETTYNQKQKIWCPPANAYAPDELHGHPHVERRVVSDSAVSARSVPMESSTDAGNARLPEVEELRKYPPFPSAYPLTPQVSSNSLPKTSSSAAASIGLPAVDKSVDVSMVAVEVEEWRQYPPFPSAYPATPQMVPRKIAGSTYFQSGLSAVSEQEQSNVYPLHAPQARERRERPKAPVSQSLPSRTGRRTRRVPDADNLTGQDFGLSSERLRVSPT